MDAVNTQAGYAVTAVCLALVAGYALFDLRSHRRAHDCPSVV